MYELTVNASRDRPAGKYQSDMTQAMTEWTNKLGKTAGQMTNTEPFHRDVNKVMELVMSMTNMQGGMDGTRVMNTYMEIMRTQASMATNAMRLALSSGQMSFGDYMSMMSKMTTANLNFISNMSNDCVPNSRAVERP